MTQKQKDEIRNLLDTTFANLRKMKPEELEYTVCGLAVWDELPNMLNMEILGILGVHDE